MTETFRDPRGSELELLGVRLSPRAWFRCVAGCPGEFPLDTIVYRCPSCGELLEVAHDLAQLARLSGPAWRGLFDARLRTPRWPEGLGVWGKREWVAPGVTDPNVVSLGEGLTPLAPAPRLAGQLGLSSLHLKQLGQNPTGSFKDQGMTVLVSVVRQMVSAGTSPVRAIVCASTGDTSAALAAYAAAAGLQAVVLLPRGKVSTAQLVQPLASGARVLALDTDFDGCMAIVKELAKEPGIYLANSMNSLRLEGQKTVAVEIVQQLGWEVPEWVVVPGGNLGNVSALAAGFEMLVQLGVVDRRPRLVVAQAEQANPLYRAFVAAGAGGAEAMKDVAPVAAGPTLASAIQIGNPVSSRRAIAALSRCAGLVEQATEAELCAAAARADRAGLFTCPHTAVALAALEKLVARGTIEPGQRVVVVSTATGLKFSEFKVAYHEGRLPSPEHRNPVVELPADLHEVRQRVLDGT
jgi:threonine synthase